MRGPWWWLMMNEADADEIKESEFVLFSRPPPPPGNGPGGGPRPSVSDLLRLARRGESLAVKGRCLDAGWMACFHGGKVAIRPGGPACAPRARLTGCAVPPRAPAIPTSARSLRVAAAQRIARPCRLGSGGRQKLAGAAAAADLRQPYPCRRRPSAPRRRAGDTWLDGAGAGHIRLWPAHTHPVRAKHASMLLAGRDSWRGESDRVLCSPPPAASPLAGNSGSDHHHTTIE